MPQQKHSPWIFIPTLYFVEGLPYILINSVSVYMFKSFQVSNQVVGLASIIMLPWVLKMLWSPIVDIHASKRSWTITMQLLLGVCFAGVAVVLNTQHFLIFVVGFLVVAAFISATSCEKIGDAKNRDSTKNTNSFFIEPP